MDLKVIINLFCSSDENDPYYLVYSGAERKATIQRVEIQFGGDCMLGKLCRLEKHCGQLTAGS
jgi:hypothetical protein